MKSSTKNIRLSSLDDLFSTEETRQEAQADAGREKVRMIPLDELHPFAHHPFKVKDDEAMQDTVDVGVSNIGYTSTPERKSREGWRFAKQIRPDLD